MVVTIVVIVGIIVIGVGILAYRNRTEKGIESGITSFRRELHALAPRPGEERSAPGRPTPDARGVTIVSDQDDEPAPEPVGHEDPDPEDPAPEAGDADKSDDADASDESDEADDDVVEPATAAAPTDETPDEAPDETPAGKAPVDEAPTEDAATDAPDTDHRPDA